MIRFALLVLSTLAVPAAAYVPTAEDRLFALTPADFQAVVHSGDDVAAVVVLDTERGYSAKKGLMASDLDDNYLRASIDRASGKVVYELVQRVSYRGGWRYFKSVAFEGGGAPVTVIARDHACFSSAPNGCLLTERVAFAIPEATLRTLAANWRPKARDVWRYKLIATANADFDGALAPAEAAGLLRAVEAWKAKRDIHQRQGAGRSSLKTDARRAQSG